MNAKRYYYVKPKGGKRLHISLGRVHSGGQTACGMMISLGWLWTRTAWGSLVCLNCSKILEDSESMSREPTSAS